jgi:leucyl/phenylalanyl-tRNA--protein transferase
MKIAYIDLHQRQIAHSLEIWQDQTLVGGIYGLAIGRAFFGESMFSRVANASKVALVSLAKQLQQWDFGFIDCQMQTTHLHSMGARTVPRHEFKKLLLHYTSCSTVDLPWQLSESTNEAPISK